MSKLVTRKIMNPEAWVQEDRANIQMQVRLVLCLFVIIVFLWPLRKESERQLQLGERPEDGQMNGGYKHGPKL